MRILAGIFLIFSLMFLTACVTAPAFAGDSILSLLPVANYLLDYAVVGVVAILGWGFTQLTKYTRSILGLRIDESQRAVVMGALERGVNFAADILRQRLKDNKKINIDVRSELIKRGTEYVQSRVPDAISHFKLTPSDIGDMLAAKLEEQGVFDKFKNTNGS